MSRKYQIEVTEEQLRSLSEAAELFARLRTGQFGDIVWKVFPDLMGKEHNSRMINDLLERAFFLIRGKHSNESSDSERTARSRMLWDLHQVFRNRLYWDKNPEGKEHNVDSYDPLHTGAEPLAKVQAVEP